MEKVMEVIAVELNLLPAEMRVWVCELKPRTVAEVGKFADYFAQARDQMRWGQRMDSRTATGVAWWAFGQWMQE